jgi:hypothetical protein
VALEGPQVIIDVGGGADGVVVTVDDQHVPAQVEIALQFLKAVHHISVSSAWFQGLSA